MEDALALFKRSLYKIKIEVLILVLMEDALAPLEVLVLDLISKSLNPCFNGRCTRTHRLYLTSNRVES